MVPLAAGGEPGRGERNHERARRVPSCVLSLLLIRGMQESAFVNIIIVVTKVAIVLMVIAIGWGFMNTGQPYAVHSVARRPIRRRKGDAPVRASWASLGAAGVVFFAFIGFDAVSTAAQEAKNPKRDMPIGILGSLVVCTVLYVLFSHVLSGVATVEDFRTAARRHRSPSPSPST